MTVDLNQLVVLSLILLALVSVLTFAVILPLAMQASRTLSSAQNLLNTINNDLEPTAKEIRETVNGVKDIFSKGSETVNKGVKVANVAVKSGAFGFLVGLKNYFNSYKNSDV